MPSHGKLADWFSFHLPAMHKDILQAHAARTQGPAQERFYCQRSSDPFAFYCAFGVARDATVDAIREECKKLVLHYHPDMCAETEPEQSSRAAGRCGSTSWTWNGESN
jgi:hypothetical protein